MQEWNTSSIELVHSTESILHTLTNKSQPRVYFIGQITIQYKYLVILTNSFQQYVISSLKHIKAHSSYQHRRSEKAAPKLRLRQTTSQEKLLKQLLIFNAAKNNDILQ